MKKKHNNYDSFKTGYFEIFKFAKKDWLFLIWSMIKKITGMTNDLYEIWCLLYTTLLNN